MFIEYTAKVRVNYYDTDQMGVVWHGNYLKYFEDAREEMLRSRGLPYEVIEARGIVMPIVEAGVRYMRPARYGDILDVNVTVAEPPRSKLKIDYEIRNQAGELCAKGFTTMTCVSAKTLAPCRPPAELLTALQPIP